jgi:L-asparagine oxygenase
MLRFDDVDEPLPRTLLRAQCDESVPICRGLEDMREIKRLSLDPRECADLKHKLASIGSPYDDMEGFLLSAFPIGATLPKPILTELQAFRNDPQSPGILLIEGWPLDDEIPATPINGRRNFDKQTYISEGCVLAVAKTLGEPLGYYDEKDGEIIQNLAPIKKEASSTSSESADIDLAFHTDLDFDKYNPHRRWNETNADFIALLCLRQDPAKQACTLYADARDICRNLSRRQLELLRQPLFEFRAAYTFTAQAGVERIWSLPIPIVQGPESSPEITLEMACGVRGVSAEASAVLDDLAAVLKDSEFVQFAYLSRGEMLLINNRKGAHARSAFKAAFDGSDRWLHRLYIRRSLWELRNDRTRSMRLF